MLNSEKTETRHKTVQNDLHRILRVMVEKDGWIQIEKVSRNGPTDDWRTTFIRMSPEHFMEIVAFVSLTNDQRQ